MYSKYGITFDSVGEPSFDNCTVRNVITFGADSSSSSHSYNSKNNILILGEGPTFGINGIFGSPERKSLVLLESAWV